MQALSQLSYTPTKGAHYTGRISLCKEWETGLFDSEKKTPVRFRTGVLAFPVTAPSAEAEKLYIKRSTDYPAADYGYACRSLQTLR